MSEDMILNFDTVGLMKMLPHRYPFLLVDKITECVPGKYSKGYKNLTINEQFFAGHFPNNPVMPGVLQLEALAQLSCGIIAPLKGYEDKLFFYTGIDKVRFRKPIRPGDRFDMEAELVKLRDPIVKIHAKGFVDGMLAVEADLMFSIVGEK